MNGNRKRMLRKKEVLEAGAHTPDSTITSGLWGVLIGRNGDCVLSAITDAERIGDLPAGGITLARGEAIHGKFSAVTVGTGDVVEAWEFVDGFAE